MWELGLRPRDRHAGGAMWGPPILESLKINSNSFVLVVLLSVRTILLWRQNLSKIFFSNFIIDLNYTCVRIWIRKAYYNPQQTRKHKKVQAKKLMKSNKSIFFPWNCIFGSFLSSNNWCLTLFEMAKNGIWSKKFFVKLINLVSSWFHEFFGLDFF